VQKSAWWFQRNWLSLLARRMLAASARPAAGRPVRCERKALQIKQGF